MRLAPWISLVAVAAAACGTPATAASSEPAAAAPEQPDRAFRATFVEPCGASLLEIRDQPGGSATRVRPVGAGSPLGRLRPHVLLETHLIVHGHLTGVVRDDGHCGPVAEL